MDELEAALEEGYPPAAAHRIYRLDSGRRCQHLPDGGGSHPGDLQAYYAAPSSRTARRRACGAADCPPARRPRPARAVRFWTCCTVSACQGDRHRATVGQRLRQRVRPTGLYAGIPAEMKPLRLSCCPVAAEIGSAPGPALRALTTHQRSRSGRATVPIPSSPARVCRCQGGPVAGVAAGRDRHAGDAGRRRRRPVARRIPAALPLAPCTSAFTPATGHRCPPTDSPFARWPSPTGRTWPVHRPRRRRRTRFACRDTGPTRDAGVGPAWRERDGQELLPARRSDSLS